MHLNDNLFILNDALREGLLNIQKMCHNMSEVSFIDGSNIEDFLLFYFIENQVVIFASFSFNEKDKLFL